MFKVEVCQEKKTGGFRVWVTYCPGSDEMYEVFHHFYLFKSEKRAERLAQKVRNAGIAGMNLDFWGYYDSPCSPLAGVQQKSKAVKMTVPALLYFFSCFFMTNLEVLAEKFVKEAAMIPEGWRGSYPEWALEKKNGKLSPTQYASQSNYREQSAPAIKGLKDVIRQGGGSFDSGFIFTPDEMDLLEKAKRLLESRVLDDTLLQVVEDKPKFRRPPSWLAVIQ